MKPHCKPLSPRANNSFKMSAVLTSQVPSQEENMPPLDPPVSHYVLNRRRHGISSGLTVEAVYQSEPRMNRRNAISYESDDAAAKYIRYLGVFWWSS